MPALVTDGTKIRFDPMFGHRRVRPLVPAIMRGTGTVHILGRRCCVSGDERAIRIPATYSIPGYTPGSGIIRVRSLGPTNLARDCTQGQRPLILNGGKLVATFTPLVPAIFAAPTPVPDIPVPTPGTGQFLTGQRKVSKVR